MKIKEENYIENSEQDDKETEDESEQAVEPVVIIN